MKPIKLVNSYVYVVLEYHSENTDPRVHDVFINEQEAQGKKESLTLPTVKKNGELVPPKTTNYVAVLKKPIKGKERQVVMGNKYLSPRSNPQLDVLNQVAYSAGRYTAIMDYKLLSKICTQSQTLGKPRKTVY